MPGRNMYGTESILREKGVQFVLYFSSEKKGVTKRKWRRDDWQNGHSEPSEQEWNA